VYTAQRKIDLCSTVIDYPFAELPVPL
jgi:hypothetical protein